MISPAYTRVTAPNQEPLGKGTTGSQRTQEDASISAQPAPAWVGKWGVLGQACWTRSQPAQHPWEHYLMLWTPAPLLVNSVSCKPQCKSRFLILAKWSALTLLLCGLNTFCTKSVFQCYNLPALILCRDCTYPAMQRLKNWRQQGQRGIILPSAITLQTLFHNFGIEVTIQLLNVLNELHTKCMEYSWECETMAKKTALMHFPFLHSHNCSLWYLQ